MAQGPLAASVAKNPANALVPMLVDATGALKTVDANSSPPAGGTSSALNVTAAKVIKATPGRLAKVVVVAPGTTSGALTINDCATVGAAAAANEIASIGFAGLTAGQVISLDWPCLVGIVVSAVPGAGSPVFSISYS